MIAVVDDIKCYYISLVASYSKRVLYGYKCDLDQLRESISRANRFVILDQYKDQCALPPSVLDDLTRYKYQVRTTSPEYCRGC